MTVLPEPVEPSIAPCLASTCGAMSMGSFVSLRVPKNNPLGLYVRFDTELVDSTSC